MSISLLPRAHGASYVAIMKITVKQLKQLVRESTAINDDGDDMLGQIPDLGRRLLEAIDMFDTAVQEYAKAGTLSGVLCCL